MTKAQMTVTRFGMRIEHRDGNGNPYFAEYLPSPRADPIRPARLGRPGHVLLRFILIMAIAIGVLICLTSLR